MHIHMEFRTHRMDVTQVTGRQIDFFKYLFVYFCFLGVIITKDGRNVDNCRISYSLVIKNVIINAIIQI